MSKHPLSSDASPRVEPNAATDPISQQKFAAGLAQRHKMPAMDKTKPTVDQALAGRGPAANSTVGSRSAAPSPSLMSEVDAMPTDGPDAASEDEDREPIMPSGQIASAQDTWRRIQASFKGKFYPPPQSGPLKELLSEQHARHISFNPRAGPSQKTIAWPKDASLALVQVTGREAPQPCRRCEQGGGVFQECVTVSQDVANVLQAGVSACVNCSWKSVALKQCNVKDLMGSNTLVASKTTPSTRESASRARDAWSFSDDDSDQPLKSRRRRYRPPSDEGDSDEPLASGRRLRPDGNSSRIVATGAHQLGHSGEVSEPASLDAMGEAPSMSSPGVRSLVRLRAARARRRVASLADTGSEDLEPTLAEEPASSAGIATSKTTQSITIDKNCTFRVDFILPGTTLRLAPESDRLLVCSIATGKVVVKIDNEELFAIGSSGMFRLVPGVGAEVTNSMSMGFNAVLHITSITEQD